MGNLRRLKKDLLINGQDRTRRRLRFNGELQTVGLQTIITPKKKG
jgi:hypothetical protein